MNMIKNSFYAMGPLADQTTNKVGSPTNQIPGNGVTLDINVLEKYLENIANFMVTAGVLIAVIFIIWGGIGFMMAGGNSEKAGKAKTRLFNGIIGALIVLGVGLILRTLSHLVTQGI